MSLLCGRLFVRAFHFLTSFFQRIFFRGCIVTAFLLWACAPGRDVARHPSVLAGYLKSPTGSALVDFSYAGYGFGAQLPPVRRDLPYFPVVEYGAVPDDGIDDLDAIQAAVDAAGRQGGGIVSFPSGTFDLDVNSQGKFIRIQHSHIILRGNGSGLEGTILHDHHASASPEKDKKWLAGLYPSFVYAGPLPSDSTWRPGTGRPLTSVRAGVRNALVIDVDDAATLQAGETYLLTLEDTDQTLAYELAYPLTKLGKNHLAETFPERLRVQHLVTVVSVEHQRVHLSAPVLWDLSPKYKPALWRLPQMVTGVGIEGIRMRTDWSDAFIHHHSAEHDNGWDHIRFSFVREGWVRNVLHDGATTAVSLNNSTHCTIMDGHITGNPGHNGFGVNGFSTHNLLINLVGGSAMHTFTIQGYASGNVFHNCYSAESSSVDCHGGLGVYNLFDGIYGGVFKNGGSASNVPPVMGQKLVFWNWEMGYLDPYNGRVKNLFSKPGLVPAFIAVGVKGRDGQPVSFVDDKGVEITGDVNAPWGMVEQLNRKASPVSLYRYQQRARFQTPE